MTFPFASVCTLTEFKVWFSYVGFISKGLGNLGAVHQKPWADFL